MDMKMSFKRKRNYKYVKAMRYVLYALIIILGITLIIVTNSRTKAYNKKVYSNELLGSDMYNGIEPNIEATAKGVYDGTPSILINSGSYYGFDINLHIENKSVSKISGYHIEIDVNNDIFIPVSENDHGEYRIRQYRNGALYEDFVDFNKPKDSYNLDMVNDNGKKYIRIKEGDVLVYEPSFAITYTAAFNVSLRVYKINRIDIEYNATCSDIIEPKSGSDELAATITYSKGNYLDLYNTSTYDHYIASSVSYNLKNNHSDKMRDVSTRIDIDSSVMLTTAWNGIVEIHQDGKTTVIDNFNILRTLTEEELDSLGINYLKNVTEVFIPLNPGDYIVYTPVQSSSSISSDNTLEFGFLYYNLEDSSVTGFKTSYSYRLYKDASFEPALLAGTYILIIMAVVLIFDLYIMLRFRKVKKKALKDELILMETMNTFTGFIDAKDSYTNGHSGRVAEYAKILATELGMPEEEVKKVYFIALLHDCGKIGVPDAILNKPTKLTDDEYRVIQSHTVKGAEILSKFKSIPNIRDGALYHHERYDGKGYPMGLKGEQIPFIGRLICVCDALDAMNTDRCYRKGLSREIIIREFEMGAGTQFDPTLSDIIIKIIESGKIKTGEDATKHVFTTKVRRR